MSNSNFNDPSDKEYIKAQLKLEDEASIIPINFEILAGEDNYLSEIKDPDNMMESITNLTTTYKQFGKEFGIDIKFDIDSVSSTFRSIISSDAEKVFSVYVAKSFSKVRLSVFNKILISITTLVDRVTQQDILESDNIELSVGLIEKLLFLMEKVNLIYNEVKIESADLVLSNISKDIKLKDNATETVSDKETMDILRYLKKNKTT